MANDIKRLIVKMMGPLALACVRSNIHIFPFLMARIALSNISHHPRHFVDKTRFGSEISGYTGHLLDCHILLFKEWEPVITQWIEERLEEGDTFIDVGANIGYYSLLASKLVGTKGQVVAIEASPTMFQSLQENLSRNEAQNVRSVNIAASDHSGSIELFRGPPENPAETTTESSLGFELECVVPTEPLSQLIKVEEFKCARLVKMDIEGAEWVALKGLVPLFKHAREDLEFIVETNCWPSEKEGSHAADIISLMAEAGYIPYQIENVYTFAPYFRRVDIPRPKRVRGQVTERCDLIFSKADKEEL